MVPGKQTVTVTSTDGQRSAKVIVAFEYDPETCRGSIISIQATTPRAALEATIGKIGLGVSYEITVSAGELTGTPAPCECEQETCKHGCTFTFNASWTIRGTLTIGYRWVDEQVTFVGTGTLSVPCSCGKEE
jgi:hypothetical protein